MDRQQQFANKLKTAGERFSSPRLAIFVGLGRKGPISIPQFVAEMQKSAIDPATTYRNIKLFRQLNIIRDIGTGGKRMIELSDDYDSHHHHFWCRECGAVIDFDNPEIEALLTRMAQGLEVQIMSHHLELSGRCAKCRD